MVSGYEILWTANALAEVSATLSYLEEHWTTKELTQFAHAVDHTLELISRHPELFPESDFKTGVRRAVVDGNNTLYYQIAGTPVHVLSVFATKQQPS
jgi:plasmid stabilization system protein ParE